MAHRDPAVRVAPREAVLWLEHFALYAESWGVVSSYAKAILDEHWDALAALDVLLTERDTLRDTIAAAHASPYWAETQEILARALAVRVQEPPGEKATQVSGPKVGLDPDEAKDTLDGAASSGRQTETGSAP